MTSPESSAVFSQELVIADKPRVNTKVRQLLGFTALVLGCSAVAVPAQAGLGDLVSGALDEVIEVVTTVTAPLLAQAVEEVVSLPPISTPEITIGPVEIPPVVVVDDVGVAVGEDLPVKVPGDGTAEPDATPLASVDPPAVPVPEIRAAGTPIRSETKPHVPASSIKGELFRRVAVALLANPAPMPVQPLEVVPTTIEVPSNDSWLASLKAWLGVDVFAAVLAIPARLLSLLWRALTSAGSGLVAPTAVLVAIATGWRRKFLPAGM